MIKLTDLLNETSSDWWYRDEEKFWRTYFSKSIVSDFRKLYNSRKYKKARRKLEKVVDEYIFYNKADSRLVNDIVEVLESFFKLKAGYNDMIKRVVNIVKNSNWDNTNLQK